MMLIESFTGRWSPLIHAPVQMQLYANLKGIYKLVFKCGYKTETYDNLSEAEAIHRWVANRKWWS
jgi:hypothetical protein